MIDDFDFQASVEHFMNDRDSYSKEELSLILFTIISLSYLKIFIYFLNMMMTQIPC